MDFYKMLSKYYDVIFPVNEQSVLFIDRRIDKGSILDLGAGTGNHAIALAKLGHSVTATDIDRYMTEKIEEKSRRQDVVVETATIGMENIDLLRKKTFSTIICLGNSLVHLKDLDEVLTVLTKLHHLLTKNGKLFIQIVNYDHILREKITHLPVIHRENEGISFKRTYKFQNDHLLFHGLLTNGETTYENEIQLLPITCKQLEALLTKAGFCMWNTYGSYQGEPFQIDSPALIFEIEK